METEECNRATVHFFISLGSRSLFPINFQFIFYIFIKSYKSWTKSTSYEVNNNVTKFDWKQRSIWKDKGKKTVLNWIVHPKNENYVINYSPSCRSKPVTRLFLFGTQIKIFLMKRELSERNQRSLHWLRSGVLSRMALDDNSGRKLAEQIMLLFSFAQKVFL